MSQTIIPWQMKDADGNLLSPNVWTNTIYDADGNQISGIATEREVGDAYDSSKTYPTYSPYCIHNNKLYKYSGASGTTTTGTWDSTKWTETDVAGELSTINSNLTVTDVSFTDTTSSAGVIITDYDFATTNVIKVYATNSNGSYYCMVRPSSSGKLVIVVLKDGQTSLPLVTSQSVTVHMFVMGAS